MNGKTSPPLLLAHVHVRPAPRRGRGWLLALLLLLLLLLAGGLGGAFWWRGHAAPLSRETGPDPDAGTTGSKARLSVCSDEDDPKYLEHLDFGPPIDVPLERRFLDALPGRPLPPLEVYPWQPRELVAILGEHRMRGNLIAASPDGKLLAVAQAGSPFVRVGEVRTLHEKVVLSCPQAVHALAWSPDGDRLAVSCADNQVRCYTVSSLELMPSPVSLERTTGLVTSLSFSADGKYLLGGDNTPKRGIAWVWGLGDQKILRQLKHTGPVAGVAFSPVVGDSRALTSGGPEDSRLCLWDAIAGTLQASIDFSPPKKTDTSTLGPVAFSPDGKRALSSHPDRAVRIWDLDRFEKGKELLRLEEHDGNLPLACFSPDGRHMATARYKDGGVWLWDAGTGKQVRRLATSGGVWAVRFLGDGARLVFTGTSTGWDQTVHVHEVQTGTELAPPVGHLTALTGVSLAPAGRLVATGASDPTLRLWDLKDVSQRHAVPTSGPTTGVGFHPDGKRSFFFGIYQAILALVDCESGKAVTPGYDKPHNGGILSAAVSRDGSYVLTGGYHDGTVRMYRLRDGRQVRLFDLGKDQGPAAVTLAPDTRRALRVGGKTRLLQLRCQQVLRDWPAVEWAPFLPDGRAVFFGGGEAPLWEISADGAKEGGRIPLHQTGIVAGHVSGDGKRVALVAAGRVAVYDLPRAKLVWSWTPPPHFGGIAGVALAPDASHLLTANGDGTAYVIRLP
jgi:WD40 repeat protein